MGTQASDYIEQCRHLTLEMYFVILDFAQLFSLVAYMTNLVLVICQGEIDFSYIHQLFFL